MFGLRALTCLLCLSFAACDTSTGTGATGKIGIKGSSGESNITLASDHNCDADQVPNCNDGCTTGWWLGDGECDTVLNCAQLSYDNGDCS